MMRARIAWHVSLMAAIVLPVLLVVVLLWAGANWSAAASPYSYTWTDDFGSSYLHPLWSWVREDPTHWSLTAQPGFLRIVSQQGYLFGSGGNAKNLLLQNAPSGDFEICTHVFFTPTANFQIAGLLVYQDDDNYLLLGRAYCDTAPPTCAGNAIYFDHEEGGSFVGSNCATTTTLQGEAYCA